MVAELLQVSPEGLQKSVTFKLMVRGTHLNALKCERKADRCLTPQDTVREKIYTPLTVESAVDAR